MTTAAEQTSDMRIFHKLWAVSAVTATIFVVPITLWGETRPWLMAVPVAISVSFVILLEMRDKPQMNQSEAGVAAIVTALPQEFGGLAAHGEKLGLYIEVDKVPSVQMNLFGGEESVGKVQRRIIVLRDEQGRKFTLVECDRFMAKVNNVIEEDVKRAAEHAFKTGWKRLEELANERPEIGRILNDPLVLDAVKSDFHSNVSICMAKAGDFAAKKFAEDASDPAAAIAYRITADKQKRQQLRVCK
jgi:hypothetical protein